jgi:hypothetical protein
MQSYLFLLSMLALCFHDKCEAGTNERQSYVPPQCHCSSMRDTIIPAETVTMHTTKHLFSSGFTTCEYPTHVKRSTSPQQIPPQCCWHALLPHFRIPFFWYRFEFRQLLTGKLILIPRSNESKVSSLASKQRTHEVHRRLLVLRQRNRIL